MTLELDKELCEVRVPKVFAEVLAERSHAHAALGRRCFNQKHEHAEATQSETKARRFERVPKMLREKERRT